MSSFIGNLTKGGAGGAGLGAALGTALVPGVGTLIGAAAGTLLGAGEGAISYEVQKSAPNPQLQTPTVTPTVTSAASLQAGASTTAIQSQLAKEQNARSAGSVLTSPGGLTDEPTTTGSLLTGV